MKDISYREEKDKKESKNKFSIEHLCFHDCTFLATEKLLILDLITRQAYDVYRYQPTLEMK